MKLLEFPRMRYLVREFMENNILNSIANSVIHFKSKFNNGMIPLWNGAWVNYTNYILNTPSAWGGGGVYFPEGLQYVKKE